VAWGQLAAAVMPQVTISVYQLLSQLGLLLFFSERAAVV
jgi:hypothetical protein